MTNSYSDPMDGRQSKNSLKVDPYLVNHPRQNGTVSVRSNGVAPRVRGYSTSSTESGASSQFKSATLPRNHTPFQRSYSSHGSNQGSNPSTPRSSKKKYDDVPSSGYGRPRKSPVQSSGYGQPCKVHDNPGHKRTLSSSNVNSSGYGDQLQATPRRDPQRHQRTYSATSSGYGTRSSAGSAPEYNRSPANISNFSRNNLGYRSLRIPSKTSQMYDDYGGGSPDSFHSGHRQHLPFDQMSNTSDGYSDCGSLDMRSGSKIPVYHGKTAPSPIKPPPDSKLPVKVQTSPDPQPQQPSPFQRSRSFRKW